MALAWSSVASAADASTDAADDGAADASTDATDDGTGSSTGDATDDGANGADDGSAADGGEAGPLGIVDSNTGSTCAVSGALDAGSQASTLAFASLAVASLLVARRRLRRADVQP